MTVAPTITTARLRLRSFTADDFGPLAADLATARARFMGGPFTRKQSWCWFTGEVASWPLMGFGGWAVERREDATLVGEVAIAKPPHFPEPEIGWMLLGQFEGRGYAAEAARAVLDWAAATGGFETLVSYITPGNARSIALAERLGAEHDPKAPLPTGETPAETVVYRHRMVPNDAQGGMEAYS